MGWERKKDREAKAGKGRTNMGRTDLGDDKEWLFVGGRGTDKRGRKEEEGEEMEKRWRRRERWREMEEMEERWKRDGEMRLKKERRKEGRKDEERRK